MTECIPFECESRIASLFARMAGEGVGLCVWKSADRWEDGVSGKTDFDVLVAEGQISKACALMIEEGWIPANAESWRRFEGLHDYFTFIAGRGLHMHLHARIVSGEKMVKSLRPALTSLYFECLKQPGAYPPFVQPELELILFLVRTALKVSWIDIAGAIRRCSARAVYRNYQHEYYLLREQCDPQRIEQLLQDERLACLPTRLVLDACEDIAHLGWRERSALRAAVAPWRDKGILGPWLPGLLRGWRKRFEGVGKRLPFPGISLAICGPDGSGKTTTVNAVHKLLGRHLRTRRYYMGGNMAQPGKLRLVIMKPLRWPYLVLREACKLAGFSAGAVLLESAYKALNLKLMWGEKRRRLSLARRAMAVGEIALFERYPLFFPYGDDMANSVHNVSGVSAMPDLLVYLDAEPEVVIQRREGEDETVLLEKVRAFRQHRERCLSSGVQVLVLKGDASLEHNIAQIAAKVDTLLAARARSQCTSGLAW